MKMQTPIAFFFLIFFLFSITISSWVSITKENKITTELSDDQDTSQDILELDDIIKDFYIPKLSDFITFFVRINKKINTYYAIKKYNTIATLFLPPPETI